MSYSSRLKAKRRLEMDGVSCNVKRRRLSSTPNGESEGGSECVRECEYV